MNSQMVVELGRNALTVTLLLLAPILGGALAVGMIVSIFQAVTQINEATLTFVPKIVAVLLIAAVLGPWMLDVMVSYTAGLFGVLPNFVR